MNFALDCVLLTAAGALTGALCAALVTLRYAHRMEGLRLSLAVKEAFDRGFHSGVNSELVAERIEVAASRSARAAEEAAKQRLTVQIDPVFEQDTGFFTKTTQMGYAVQPLIDGLPVGDPTIRILTTVREADQAAMERAWRILESAIDLQLQSLVARGLRGATSFVRGRRGGG